MKSHPTESIGLNMKNNNAAKFQNALIAHKNNDVANAQAGYEEVLRADPNHADANHNYGVLITQFSNEAHKAVTFFLQSDIDQTGCRSILA